MSQRTASREFCQMTTAAVAMKRNVPAAAVNHRVDNERSELFDDVVVSMMEEY